MPIQTKQQKRARFALQKISEYKNSCKDSKEFHDLANFIVRMPNMILSNGLGQTLAFLLSKSDKQKKVFSIIKEWIQQNPKNSFYIKGEENIDFLKSFCEIEQKKYLEIQNEILRLVEWLKRYARAFDDYDNCKEKEN